MTQTRTSPSPSQRGRSSRFTVRHAGGVALFLLGTTYLWLTREFATAGLDTSGAWWSATEIGSLLTVAGFTVATWGLLTRRSW